MKQPLTAKIYLEPVDNQRLANLCGQNDEYIHLVEKHFDVVIAYRGHSFQITGDTASVNLAQNTLLRLYAETSTKDSLTPKKMHLILKDNREPASTHNISTNEIAFHTKAGIIKAYTANQQRYIQNVLNYDINFCIGPAGTGKTYLAVACAVDALEKQRAQRILLVRPAVEAGEKLGFLPGDLSQKIEPYLRPLYDALFEMLGFEQVGKLLAQGIIEIAPLAFMRGRTLNESFVILDESQNTTTEQMKMFLTRIGFGSKAIITGDITQVDLPRDKKSGLIEAKEILQQIPGICFTYFDSKDVVRHNLVQQIIEAYDHYAKK